ncbi:unnamed protein product [Linum tenue]|uniref:Uncharacterized protein n=1 Tax=Linum tenue TaxID=586396 RepID=A0AAV0HBS5_9ROSI|nr:unnamed protein product [Linum tenue]
MLQPGQAQRLPRRHLRRPPARRPQGPLRRLRRREPE